MDPYQQRQHYAISRVVPPFVISDTPSDGSCFFNNKFIQIPGVSVIYAK